MLWVVSTGSWLLLGKPVLGLPLPLRGPTHLVDYRIKMSFILVQLFLEIHEVFPLYPHIMIFKKSFCIKINSEPSCHFFESCVTLWPRVTGQGRQRTAGPWLPDTPIQGCEGRKMASELPVDR